MSVTLTSARISSARFCGSPLTSTEPSMGTILSTTPPALKASPKVPVESKAGDRAEVGDTWQNQQHHSARLEGPATGASEVRRWSMLELLPI